MSDKLEEKIQQLSALLAPFSAPEIEIYSGKTSAYRMRAEFRIWHKDGQIFYAMSDADKKIIKIDEFPRATTIIQELMPKLLQYLNQSEILKKRLFQVEFLASSINDILVTLLYHRPLDEDWKIAAEALSQQLNLQIIGRSRKQKIVLERDYINEKFTVAGQDFFYRQYESAFSQPNAEICAQMLNWVYSKTEQQDNDLLELYCGNGNFTLPLSKRFRRVFATEISSLSMKALRENILKNNIDNIDCVRMSAQEFSEAYSEKRLFKRLIQQKIDLKNYNFSTVLVDPPRAGIDEQTLELLQQFPSIIYVSCNPQTLADNLQILCQRHSIIVAALFDQFPDTAHTEAAVILQGDDLCD